VHVCRLYPHLSLVPRTSFPLKPLLCHVRMKVLIVSNRTAANFFYQERANVQQTKSILIVNKLRTKPVIDTIDSFLE
jgi:hypothetical protein